MASKFYFSAGNDVICVFTLASATSVLRGPPNSDQIYHHIYCNKFVIAVTRGPGNTGEEMATRGGPLTACLWTL